MRIQIVSIICSLCFLVFVFELTRKEKISEAYSLLWLFMGGIFFTLSIWRQGLEYFAQFVGIAYSPTALLLVLIIGVILILIQYSVVVSHQTSKIKQLSQEHGLLALKVKELQRQRDSSDK